MDPKRVARALSLLLILLMLVPFAPEARADSSLSIRDRKGTVPAEAPWLDRESFTDGSGYEDVPNGVQTVRIGLCFAGTAVDEAWFENSSGLGFRIGVYDDLRNFIQWAFTDCSFLVISWAEFAEDGLQILGGDELEPVYYSGASTLLAIEPIDGETIFNENSYRGGFECRMAGDGLMTIVNCVGLEDYVKGVVPYEMANGWPMEALKAQAVCARTYVVYNQNAYADFGFDLTDDTECQVYKGTGSANARTDDAVDLTAGELVRYRGEICEIYYSSADGGATEDGIYVFDSDRPYLCGKRDPFEAAEDYAYKAWSVDRTGEEIRDRLIRRGKRPDTIVEVTPEYSSQGNAIAVKLKDASGMILRLEGRTAYTVLGLPSCRYHVRTDEDGFHFDGSGLGQGHG